MEVITSCYLEDLFHVFAQHRPLKISLQEGVFRCCKCFLGCYNIAVILLVKILPLYISGLDLALPMTGVTIGPQAPSTGMPSCEVLIIRLSSVKL